MVRTWKFSATGSVLIGVAILAACSGSGEDSAGSGGKGSGASGGTGGATGGTGGATGGTGGATGGTGGATGGTGGATGGTAGMATGGTAGVATGGTAGASGGMTGGPFACKGTVATCNAISSFGADPVQWGSGDFHGGVSVFGDGIMRDPATDALHITGMVAGYGRGFNLWFSYCSDLSAFTGVSFIAKGTAGMPTATDMPNIIQFQLQTNTDYPWEPFVMSNGVKGGCTAPAGMDPWGYCQAPTYNATLGDAAQTVTWAMMAGGAPTMWDAAASPKEIVGIQFQFPWKEMGTAYTVDVTVDDIKFTGAAAETDCGTYMAGSGGMGNAGAAGAAGTGTAGAAGSGTAGAAGSGTAGASGAGGMGAAGAAGTGSGGAGAGGMANGGAGAGGAGAGGMANGGAGAGGAGAGGMSGSN